MANDIAWVAVDFLTSIKEVVEKDFPDESVPGSDVYLKAIVRSYLVRPGTEPSSNDVKGKSPADDSKYIIELMGLVRYLDKKVKHLEGTHDKATGNHGVKTFPGYDDTQETLLREYLGVDNLAVGHKPTSSDSIPDSPSSTCGGYSPAGAGGVNIESDAQLTFYRHVVYVPFSTNEEGNNQLRLQFVIDLNDQECLTTLDPHKLPATLVHHIAGEMKHWQQQTGVFKPCVGHRYNPRGTVRVHFSNARFKGAWRGYEEYENEYACFDCISSQRFCFYRPGGGDKTTFMILPLPPFVRQTNQAEDEAYWRSDDGVDTTAISKLWKTY